MNILELYNGCKTIFTDLEIQIYIAEAIRRNDESKLKVSQILDKFNISMTKLVRNINKLNKYYSDGEIDIDNKQIVFRINVAYDLTFTKHPDFQPLWNEFMDIRKKKKASQTDRAIKSLLKRLLALSDGDDNKAIKILEKSCDMGWKDVFPLKEQEAKNVIERNVNEFVKRSWNQ